MKITKRQLKQLIKEELDQYLSEQAPENPVAGTKPAADPAKPAAPPAKPAQIDPLKFAGMLCQVMGGTEALTALAHKIIEDPTQLAGLAQQYAKVLLPVLKQFGIPDISKFVNTVQPMVTTVMKGFIQQAKAASDAAQSMLPFKIPVPEEILRQTAIALAKGVATSAIMTACQQKQG